MILAAFAFVSIYCVNIFPRTRAGEFAQSSNELSRYELVMSIVDRGSFSIGPEIVEYGDHEDKSVYRGRFYSNKAPGLAFAGVPIYAAIKVFTGPARFGNLTPDFFLIRLLTVSAVTFGALVVFARRLERTAPDSGWAPIVLFAVAFGTPLLIYARTFFSHAWTASLLYLAFECLHRPEEKRWHPVLAGLLAGWAVLSEYPVAIVAAILFVDAAWRKPISRTAAFIAGALPPALLLLYYDASCFAGPFDLSSAHEASRQFVALSRAKFFGFELPSPRVALTMLFSPSRGVLAESPFFLSLPLALLRRRGRGRAEVVSFASTMILFVAMCAYENWHGGWAVGPRYLVPAVLLAAWPLAHLSAADSHRRRLLFAACAAYASLFFLWSGVTFWFYPATPWNGIRFFSAFWLSKGWLVPTLAGSSWPAILPMVAATVVAAGAAFRPLIPRGSDATLAALGAAAGFTLLFAGPPPQARFADRLTRARIFESFTVLDPDRSELLRLGPEAETPSDRAAWEGVVHHYFGGR